MWSSHTVKYYLVGLKKIFFKLLIYAEESQKHCIKQNKARHNARNSTYCVTPVYVCSNTREMTDMNFLLMEKVLLEIRK